MRSPSPKILQLLPALGDGGVERGTVEMAGYLSQMKIENWVVSSGGPLTEQLAATDAHYINLDVGRKSPFAILSNARTLARIIDENGIDLVHARSRAPAWAGWLACRQSRRKPRFLTTFHGVYSHGNRFKRAYNSVMLKAPVVVANSGFIRDHIVSVYGFPLERIIVSQRGVDTAIFNPDLVSADERSRVRAELGVAGDTPLVTIVGRITDWKGHRYMIEAMALCENKAFRLAIVGSGNQGIIDELEAKVKENGLSERVTITGSRRDIPAVMAASDLAVSTSTRPEAFGRVAIEAQVMGTPVIATAHGGSLETIIEGETGFLVSPANAKALAEAIDAALADPARLRAMGQAGRANILENFTVEQMLENEFAAYEAVLEA